MWLFCAAQSALAYKTMACGVMLGWGFCPQVQGHGWEGDPCRGLPGCSTCSGDLRHWQWVVLAAGCLPEPGCRSSCGSLPDRRGARSRNAERGSLPSADPRAALASLRQLRVYGLVVCDVMRVLALRNFTTEGAVWNAGRILETFECALGFSLGSSEQRCRWIRASVVF